MGNLDKIDWRSSEFTGLPVAGTDNWHLMSWDRESGETVVLGSAKRLNGSSDTPALDGEVVPTANDARAFFTSYQGSGDEWKLSCLPMTWRTFYQALNRWDGADSETVFSAAPQQRTWSITGVWASGDAIAVCFSSDDATAGGYIGIWSGSFESCERWVRVDPRASSGR